MSAVGTVTDLYRWPVKSMGGEPVEALDVAVHGAAGDRGHALLHEHKGERRRLTAREAPRLLAWTATYPGDLDEPVLRPPGGREWSWSDPVLPGLLTEDLGRRVWLHSDRTGQQDLADSVLVTTQATLRAVGRELGHDVDLRRFRTNIHLELDAPPFAEEEWQGRRLQVGDCELELLHPCERCAIPTRDPDTQEKWAVLLRHLFARHSGRFGINARAGGHGTIRRGDRVRLGS